MLETIDLRSANLEDDIDKISQKLASRSKLEMKSVINSVSEIVNDVRISKDGAVIRYTEQFDGVKLAQSSIKVSQEEIECALSKVDAKLIQILRKAKANIENFHKNQLEKSWIDASKPGILLGQVVRPLECVGVYVPGGTAPLPSSVLMNVIPAKVAGVGNIVMCTPPSKDGTVSEVILAAAYEAGVDEIYKIGGAQAIAAMAFGTDTVKKVDKITGPGNIYVNTAKRLVYGYCDIDMFAGPSEIMIIADDSAKPEYVAADMLSQAEHDVLAASVLVTTSETVAEQVKYHLISQSEALPRKNIIADSLSQYGAAVLVKDMKDAAEIANLICPEHLELCVKEPFNVLGDIKNAGAVFLGNYSPEPLGDYFAGPNHVLPTSGTAKFFSPLGVYDFVKKMSIISYSREELMKVAEDVYKFAKAEGLDAHANAISIRK